VICLCGHFSAHFLYIQNLLHLSGFHKSRASYGGGGTCTVSVDSNNCTIGAGIGGAVTKSSIDMTGADKCSGEVVFGQNQSHANGMSSGTATTTTVPSNVVAGSITNSATYSSAFVDGPSHICRPNWPSFMDPLDMRVEVMCFVSSDYVITIGVF
jgi:hypothetical protein